MADVTGGDMQQTLNTKFIATDNVSPAIKGIGASVNVLNGSLSKLDQVGQLVGLTAGIGSIAALGTAVVGSVQSAINKYEQYTQQQVKLITIMHQRMGANAEMVGSINQLIAAQTKEGVVGGSTQTAGAQQIATFVHSTAAMQSLIPVINDLAVQQHGYNVTTEDMVHIANMMGRVMDGQAGALRRVGISLSDEDEELLKTLPEQERAALLAQIITNNVGKMNEALAQTPEGKKVQALNRLNAAWVQLGSRMAGVKDRIETELASTQTGALVSMGTGIAVTFSVISGAVIGTVNALEWLGGTAVTVVQNFWPLITATAFVYAGFQAVAFVEAIYATVTGVATAATAAHTTAVMIGNAILAIRTAGIAAVTAVMIAYRSGTILAAIAQAGLNLAMYLCPAVWVAGIVMVLVGAIAVLVQSFGGAREAAAAAWSGIVNTIAWAVNKCIDMINLFIGAVNKAASLSNMVFHTGFTPVQKIGHVDWSEAAEGGAAAIENGNLMNLIANKFAPEAPDVSQYMGNSGIGSTGGDMGDLNNTASDTNGNVKAIKDHTARIADRIEMTDEEIKDLRDVAQKDVGMNYQNQHIVVTVNNENHIASGVDVEGMTGDIVKGLKAAIATTRKGVPV